ncbi:MAG: choice-of-anchor B family protein [Bacteroidia bacterium]|jgi:choice-of-anchor B domain-containing protein|nr:choice-of-anchor B family protein [Bacteroidia bacterium]
MKNTLILLALVLIFRQSVQAQVYPASNFTMVSNINPETGTNGSGSKYSGCWGWYQPGLNKEYAIACSQSGTYWVDVTNPATPSVCAYKVGAHNGAIWREVKTFQNYCYVASDDGGTNRFQIFDMQYLPDSVQKVYDSQAIFKRGHALWVDGNRLYVSSVTYSNNLFSSLNVYSLANPANPVLLRRLDQDYSFINHAHDVFARNDTVYASCGYDGLYVFRLTTSNTFSIITSLTSYPFSGYNHSSALTPNGQTLVFLDEVPAGLPVKVADVSNLSNIQVLSTINQYSNTTPHNPFIVNNQYCFVSAYQDGLQLYDISNPNAPFLAGYFDTYPLAGGNNNTWPNGATYKGQWGAYPYFPSKNIFALDQTNGIFMLSTHLYSNAAQGPNVGFTSPSVICAGSTINFTNTTTGGTSYTWTFSGGSPATSTLSNPVVNYANPGVFNVILTAGNSSAQSTYASTLSVNQISSNATFTHATCNACNNASIKVIPAGGTAPYTYTWLPTGGSASMATNLFPACYTSIITDALGCSSSKTLCVSHTTGIESYTLGENYFSVYPNPAHNSLQVITQLSDFDFSLFNALGEEVFRGHSNSPEQNMDVSELSRGMYFIELQKDGLQQRKKILLE